MGFQKLTNVSTWRRMALAAWKAPNDPTINGSVEIDMGNALEYLDLVRERTGVRVTVTHLVAKAIALAIREYPAINGIVRMGEIYQRDTIDIFILAAVDSDATHLHHVNLSGVKVESADEKDIDIIGEEVREKVAAVRAHADEDIERTTNLLGLMPQWLLPLGLKAIDFLSYDLDLDLSRLGIIYDQFGSAIITNVGVFGLKSGFAPFFPPSHCSLMLLVGEVSDKPVVRHGTVHIRPMLEVGCSADHRFIDGFQASRMTRTFEAIMSDPAKHLGLPRVRREQPAANGAANGRGSRRRVSVR
ncbi:MAG: 2-oxo acid dehydrogenase subunit E2 [Candidatus Dormibacteria bacterium]